MIVNERFGKDRTYLASPDLGGVLGSSRACAHAMHVEITLRCKACGIKGYGDAKITPSGIPVDGIRCPDGWHIECMDDEYVTHCSQRCLAHTARSQG